MPPVQSTEYHVHVDNLEYFQPHRHNDIPPPHLKFADVKKSAGSFKTSRVITDIEQMTLQ